MVSISNLVDALRSAFGSKQRRVKVQAPPSFHEFPDKALRFPVWSRFEEIAQNHPLRMAVTDEKGSLNYKQLWRKATTLGAAIAKLGSRQPVAVLARQDRKMIAALLGTVWAGRPYVFLNPALPAERLRFIIENSGADILLHDSKFDGLCATITPQQVAQLDIRETLDANASDVPQPASGPDTPFVINYTSGSTGTPSGVLRTHRALLANIRNMTNLACIGADDRIVLCLSPMAGAAAMGVFGALLNGACVLPFDVRARGMRRMAEFMREHRATFFHAVPTIFRALAREMEDGLALPDVRFVLLGGEPVFRADLEAFQKNFAPGSVFQNVLGITEGAGIIASFTANHRTKLDDDRVPVGWAVPGKKIRVVDEQGNAVVAGTAGEIVVESSDLSEGYLGEEKKTRQRYRVAADGARRLFTGDMGRIRPDDGALEFLGRKDTQFKIRGTRVSPAEVEAVLLRDPTVREAVVTLATTGDGARAGRETLLLAWLVPAAHATPVPEFLRLDLLSQLPPEFMPARFIILDSLPVMASGKVDREALNLSHPAARRQLKGTLQTRPRHSVEEVVADIWARALGEKDIGAYDHFFELGGDSLGAVTVLSELSAHYGFELPAQALLMHPTVAELSEMIAIWRANLPAASAFSGPQTPVELPPLVEVQTTGSKPALFIMPGGQGQETGLLMFGRTLALLGQDRPVSALRLSSFIYQAETMTGIDEMAAKMADVVLARAMQSKWHLLADCASGMIAVEMARQIKLRAPEQAPAAVVLTDARTNAYVAAHGFDLDFAEQQHPGRAAHFLKLLLAWEPRPVDLPLRVIASEGFISDSGDPTLGWDRYCTDIRTYRIPGAHATYLRQHPDLVARALAAALDDPR